MLNYLYWQSLLTYLPVQPVLQANRRTGWRRETANVCLLVTRVTQQVPRMLVTPHKQRDHTLELIQIQRLISPASQPASRPARILSSAAVQPTVGPAAAVRAVPSLASQSTGADDIRAAKSSDRWCVGCHWPPYGHHPPHNTLTCWPTDLQSCRTRTQSHRHRQPQVNLFSLFFLLSVNLRKAQQSY